MPDSPRKQLRDAFYGVLDGYLGQYGVDIAEENSVYGDLPDDLAEAALEALERTPVIAKIFDVVVVTEYVKIKPDASGRIENTLSLGNIGIPPGSIVLRHFAEKYKMPFRELTDGELKQASGLETVTDE